MTLAELEKIEAYLKENGYRKGDYPMHCNSDYYWWKSFGKDCNHYEEGRSLYQVLLNVYDWRKYWDRDPNLKRFNKAASITATVSVSRTIDEPSIALTWDLKDGINLEDIEDKAFEFFKYVNEKIRELHPDFTVEDMIALLSKYPKDAIVTVECCDVKSMRYDEKHNLVRID